MVNQPMSVSLKDVVVRRRRKFVLGPISQSLGATGFTIVLGPNGAGKTTLLKVLHGIERVSGGTVDWSIPEAQARQAQGYVFQSPVMLRRSVWQNLAYPLRLLGKGKAEIAESVDEWAANIGLQDLLGLSAPRLSGGERQKLAIGRALIRKPKVLFLDEPCANLDGKATKDIEAILLSARRSGTRIIMTTHDLGQARRLAEDVLFLLKGRVHEYGPAATFFEGPGTPAARAFLNGDIVE